MTPHLLFLRSHIFIAEPTSERRTIFTERKTSFFRPFPPKHVQVSGSSDLLRSERPGRLGAPASSQAQLGSPPVPPLGVVADPVARFHPDPLRNGPVLLLLLGQEPLDPEGLVRRHSEGHSQPHAGVHRQRPLTVNRRHHHSNGEERRMWAEVGA